MRCKILASIGEVEAAQWNTLSGTGNPFLRHEFLLALERNDCVGKHQGWIPRHLAVFEQKGQLLGAAPLYIKDNSYGEFVFDWSWADAYQHHGLEYYPKAVVAIPYTPVTGPRLLIGNTQQTEQVVEQLTQLALQVCRSENLSSLHYLFTNAADTQALQQRGLLLRLGCQFHWENRGYRDFEDFLSFFTARKRKKIRRERRYVEESGIEIRIVSGREASDTQLQTMYDFYRITFEKKWGYPTLTAEFFQDIASCMGEQLIFFMALKNHRIVAGSICFQGQDTLYGRHWGCYQNFHSLHFEVCYYQGIEYCIRNGLKYFEPGAQGEYKISRGFLPTATWSAHWIAHDGFREIIRRYTAEERESMQEYMEELATHSPFKQEASDV